MADLAYDRYAAPSPTPYHRTLANFLSRREPELWKWMESDETASAAADDLRLELKRRAFALDREKNQTAYSAADEIAEAMGVDAPVILYQAEDGLRRNAALYFERETAHIVFEGDALEALELAELRFLLGHELAHHALWTYEDGRLWTAYRLLRWAGAQPGCAPAFLETARLERLYTELYADRYGLWAVGDLEPALCAQAKVSSGSNDASGAAYLAEAEEILAKSERPEEKSLLRGGKSAPAEPFPETALRAALLAAWAHDAPNADIRARALLDGASPIDQLDILGQERVDDLTHWMLYEFLVAPWSRRRLVRNHARAFSDRLADALGEARVERDDVDPLRAAIAASHPSIRRYLAYTLLDFTTVDPQVHEALMAAALTFADDFGLSADFKALAASELKTTKTKLAELEKNAGAIIARAEAALGSDNDDDDDDSGSDEDEGGPIAAAGGR
ncbi:MAG: hypothetical protein MRY74_17045 [Neomegalonema sp.]|nr:hypothetical protein [Neomegalonema sp.]